MIENKTEGINMSEELLYQSYELAKKFYEDIQNKFNHLSPFEYYSVINQTSEIFILLHFLHMHESSKENNISSSEFLEITKDKLIERIDKLIAELPTISTTEPDITKFV